MVSRGVATKRTELEDDRCPRHSVTRSALSGSLARARSPSAPATVQQDTILLENAKRTMLSPRPFLPSLKPRFSSARRKCAAESLVGPCRRSVPLPRRGGTHDDMPDRGMMYACGGEGMARSATLKRRAFFVDETAVRRARRALGARTDAEAVRMSVERVAEMEAFWRFMTRSRGRLKPGSLRP